VAYCARKSVPIERRRRVSGSEFNGGRFRAKIEGARYLFIAMPPYEGDRVALRSKKFDLALGKRRMRATERKEAAVVLQHRVLVALLHPHRHGKVLGRNRQPRLCSREAAVRRVALPNHRRAATIAALELRPEPDAIRILEVVEGYI